MLPVLKPFQILNEHPEHLGSKCARNTLQHACWIVTHLAFPLLMRCEFLPGMPASSQLLVHDALQALQDSVGVLPLSVDRVSPAIPC